MFCLLSAEVIKAIAAVQAGLYRQSGIVRLTNLRLVCACALMMC